MPGDHFWAHQPQTMANTRGFRLLNHGGMNDGDRDDTMNNVAFVGLYCSTAR